MNPFPGLRAHRSLLVPQLQAGRNLCPPPGLPPSSDPVPWGFVLRLTERAGEEASGRSTSSVGKYLCRLLLSVSPNPFFLFPGYPSLGKKKRSLSSLAKAFLMFPRQTARWLGAARFARCPEQPLICSGYSRRAAPRVGGPRGSRGSVAVPLPGGCRPGSPRAGRVCQAPAAWWGLESVNGTSHHHPHRSPDWLQAAAVSPTGRTRGGGVACYALDISQGRCRDQLESQLG